MIRLSAVNKGAQGIKNAHVFCVNFRIAEKKKEQEKK